MTSPLVLLDPSSDLALPASRDQHPAAVYLARLDPGSRRAMRQALDTIASLLTGGQFAAGGPFWPALRYQHTAATLALLLQQAPAVIFSRALRALVDTLGPADQDAVLQVVETQCQPTARRPTHGWHRRVLVSPFVL